MTDRIVTRTPSTLTHRFSAEGAAGVTVTATTADGTKVLDAAAADDADGDNVWTVDVPAADLTDPTVLTVEWDASNGWVETDYVEVAGGRYLLPDDLREGSGDEAGRGLNRDRFTDELLEAAIVATERRIERATRTAWVPRYGSDTAVIMRGLRFWLPPMVRELTSIVISKPGVTPWTDDPALWHLSPLGIAKRVRQLDGWTLTAEVEFLHGHDSPPADLVDVARQAAIELAKGQQNSRIPATAESMSAGGFTFNFAHQADLKRGRPFGMPDVDTVVMSHAAEIPAVA